MYHLTNSRDTCIVWSTVAYWDFVPSKMSDFHKIPFLTVKSSIVPHLQYTSNPTERGDRGQKLWHLYQRDRKTPITPPRSRGWLHLVFLHALSKERRSVTLDPKDFVKCMDFEILESIILLTKTVLLSEFYNRNSTSFLHLELNITQNNQHTF